MARKQTARDEVAPDAKAGEQPPASGAKIFTYVGAGEDPPRKINFLGLQEFIRGKAVEVTHPTVLGKLQGHPCFVEGEVEMEDLHDQDEEAMGLADAKRKQDLKVNAAYAKKHKTED